MGVAGGEGPAEWEEPPPHRRSRFPPDLHMLNAPHRGALDGGECAVLFCLGGGGACHVARCSSPLAWRKLGKGRGV